MFLETLYNWSDLTSPFIYQLVKKPGFNNKISINRHHRHVAKGEQRRGKDRLINWHVSLNFMLMGQCRIYKVDKHVDNILRYDAKLKDISSPTSHHELTIWGFVKSVLWGAF